MTFECNDATAKMVEAFRKDDGKEALANIALMWSSAYDLINDRIAKGEDIEENSFCLDGINILTKLVKHLNEL